MENKLDIRKKLVCKSTDDRDILIFIKAVRKGIEYKLFNEFASKVPFSLSDWSRFLHISQRTIQRYKKEHRKFDSLHSEKILEIILFYQKGIDVFGSTDKFNSWLNVKSVALGGVKPITLLDNTFGINLLNDELSRIEHGILA